MIVFDGTYMLEREEDPGSRRAHASTWQVKIIDLSSGDPSRPHIRPYAIFATRAEDGIFKSSCAEGLGRRIFNDFDLNVEDVLWVESFPDLPEDVYVAVFTPRYQGDDIHFTITWRPILNNEREALAPWC